MLLPDLIQEKEKPVATLSREYNVPLHGIRVMASPYRISPLGAHIDHQGGPVLGMTINAYSLLAYVPIPLAAGRTRKPALQKNNIKITVPSAPMSHWFRIGL